MYYRVFYVVAAFGGVGGGRGRGVLSSCNGVEN